MYFNKMNNNYPLHTTVDGYAYSKNPMLISVVSSDD